MIELPRYVRRAPSLLYGAAFIMFFGSLALSLYENFTTIGHLGHNDPIITQIMLRTLYQALLDAIYLAANGVIAHILLAIWAQRRSSAVDGDEQ